MKDLFKVGSFFVRLIAVIVYLVLASKYGQLQKAYIIVFVIGYLITSVSIDFMGDHNGLARVIIYVIGFAIVLISALVLNIIVIKQPRNYYRDSFFLLCVVLMFVEWLGAGELDLPTVSVDLMGLGGAIIYSWAFSVFFYNINSAILFLVSGAIVLLVMLIMFFMHGSHLYW